MIHYQIEQEADNLWLTESCFNLEFALKTESVFTACNGYLGVRAAHDLKIIEESRGMFIGGVYQKAYDSEVTELVNCPDLTEVQLSVNGVKVRVEESKILDYRRRFNVKTGELQICYLFDLKNGRQISIKSRRFVSHADKCLLCQQVSLTLINSESAQAVLETGINGQITNSGVSHFKQNDCRVYDKKYMEMTGYLQDNKVLISSLVDCDREIESEFILERRSIWGRYKTELSEGETVCFTKYSLVRDTDNDLTAAEDIKQLESYAAAGYEEAFWQHCQQMTEFWQKAAIQITGARPAEEAAISFAQYHLQGLVPHDTYHYGAAAKGLTGEGYKGHVFWDTELFVMPFFTHVFPEVSRNLLRYRYEGLAGARQKAEDYGYAGAMFPWEAACGGYEETPLYAALNIHTGKANEVWSGIKEHHVTADIVYGLWQYYSLTGDEELMERYGCEIIIEAARFWVSRAVFREEKERFEILDIIGPDEYTEHIDNNAYTNYMASFCVKLALNLINTLPKEQLEKLNQKLDFSEEIEKWERFIHKIYLPQPDPDGIIPQDDTFLQKPELAGIEKYKRSLVKQLILFDYSRDEVVDMQVLKQADLVMLLNLFPDLFAADLVKKNVQYYEKRTVHDSSLSYCAHAQAFAAIGERDLAWQFFEKAMVIDLDDNPNDSTDGIHAASLGGIWNCVIFGFAGFSNQQGCLRFRPCFPSHWQEMKFCIRTGNTLIRIIINAAEARLSCVNKPSKPIEIEFDGKRYHLIDTLTIDRVGKV